MAEVKIRVLLFAAAREAADNLSSLDLDLPPSSADTAFLRYVRRLQAKGRRVDIMFFFLYKLLRCEA